MEKPMTLRVEETEDKIVEIINEAHLSAYVLKTIIERILYKIDQVEMKEINDYNNEKLNEDNKIKESDK